MKYLNRRTACVVLTLAAITAQASAQAPGQVISQYRIAARAGQQAPGFPPGCVFDWFLYPSLDLAGRVAFVGTVRFAGGGLMNGLWMETAEGLRLVCKDGQSPDGRPELHIQVQDWGPVVRTDVDTVVFEASFPNSNVSYGTLVGSPTGVQLIH